MSVLIRHAVSRRRWTILRNPIHTGPIFRARFDLKVSDGYLRILKLPEQKNMKKHLFQILLATLPFLLTAQPDSHWQSKIEPALLEAYEQGDTPPFLVILTSRTDVSTARQLATKTEKAQYVYSRLIEAADKSQADIITTLQQHGISYRSLYIANVLRIEGGRNILELLARRSEVASIIPDPAIRYAEPVEWMSDDVQNRSAITWGLDMINADDVWEMGFRGQGVTIGGQDTGYEWDHPALKRQYRGYNAEADTADHHFNWHDAIHAIDTHHVDTINPCGLDSSIPCDDHGHGTHTMGTMIGLDEEQGEIIGVAPEAVWCACRNMERGWGTLFSYLECFQWFLAPTDLNGENPNPDLAPHVINNSWGCPEEEGCLPETFALMDEAINNLRIAGTMVVVSAGNSGSGCGSISTPAGMNEGSFSIGATAENDTIAGFSSRGPVTVDGSYRLKPDVSAPGVRVRSARLNGGYGNSSGTSMAGPHVAGMVALIISANPDLAGQVDLIEDIIRRTAVPKTTEQMCDDIPGDQVPNHTYGYGRIDALAAVQAALDLLETSTSPAPSPLLADIFPNPVTDKLIIRLTGTGGLLHIHLYDTFGRLVMREQVYITEYALLQLETVGLMPGLYYYRIDLDGRSTQGKVVKK